jgi:class 3 adenylate cyclase/predicted ATPase
MAVRCAICGFEAPDGMRFCGACGSPLPAVTARVRERRLVSVLFCDLVGFTTFSESRDHEDVRDVLGQYFMSARQIVARYGGTIEKFIGDAVMAVWGAPTAREDDAERSVRAGLELVDMVRGLAERLAIPELRVRVGVLTGEAAVELGATDEGMVTGDAVNTAARIQSVANPETVLADDTTRLACEQAVEFAPAGEHALKGKSAPVRVWRAIRIRDQLEGGYRSGAVQPPFVGRARELAAISECVRSLQELPAGVRIVSVVGDAGLGKSRLAWESERKEGLEATPIRWYRGRSLAFGEGTGLSGLADVIRMALGIGRGEPRERQRAAVERVLAEHFADDVDERLRVSRAVIRLLDLDDRQELIEQGELFSAWRALLERLAGDAAMVIVLEELQLADQALFDFVVHLRDWSAATRIMILVLSRPDRRLELLTHPAHGIAMAPLSGDEMNELVIGAVPEAPDPLLDVIRSEGGGVPLYAVETLRALADRGVLAIDGSRYVVRGDVVEVTLAPTIRALVASRLDRLAAVERQLSTAGAVLGESFTAAGAAVVAGADTGEAKARLDVLVAKALLGYQADPRSPLRGRYAFLQGVVRRVALARMSRRERKRAHLAAVEYLEQEKAREPDLEALLAAHLMAAAEADQNAADAGQIRERARTTLTVAAERAAAVGALTEALSQFDRAAELTTDEDERAEILERAGAVAFRAGNAEESSARYRAAREIHAAAGRHRQALRVRVRELQARYHIDSAAELVSELRSLDAELGDERDPVKALAGNVLAFSLYQLGSSEEALAVASRSAAIAEECGDRGELGAALTAQASALQELERPTEAIALQLRALELAQHGGPRRLAPVLGNLALSLGSIGRYAESADRAREAITAARNGAERLFERWARLVLGRALCSLGEWDAAVTEIEAVKPDVPPYYIGMAIAPLVVIALGRGQQDEIRALVAEHERRLGGGSESASDCDFRVLGAAALMMDRGDPPADLARLIEAADRADYAEWTGWLSPILDRVVTGSAVEPLAAILALLSGPGATMRFDPVRAQARRLEAHLASRRGDHDHASQCYREAAQLAGNCGAAFENAVIVLEHAEHLAAASRPVDAHELAAARMTFERLRATPWLVRTGLIDAA